MQRIDSTDKDKSRGTIDKCMIFIITMLFLAVIEKLLALKT